MWGVVGFGGLGEGFFGARLGMALVEWPVGFLGV